MAGRMIRMAIVGVAVLTTLGAVQPGTASSPIDRHCSRTSPVAFTVLKGGDEQVAPGTRVRSLEVLVDEEDLSEDNIVALARYLSERYPSPNVLQITMSADVGSRRQPGETMGRSVWAEVTRGEREIRIMIFGHPMNSRIDVLTFDRSWKRKRG